MIDFKLRRSHLLCCFKCMFSRKLMASHRIPQSVSDAAEAPGHAHACRRLWPHQEEKLWFKYFSFFLFFFSPKDVAMYDAGLVHAMR